MQKIRVRDLVNGYKDSQEAGVVGYGSRLDIRPPYQREFVYDEEQRAAVIRSVRNGFPINVMYWSKNGDLDAYEVLDGQQRTISICQFIACDFSITTPDDPTNPKYFDTLAKNEQEALLNYELHVYVCEGAESEKLEWFKTINIAGEKLTNQELRNAVYAGSWLAEAKKYFSRTNGPAANEGGDYMSGSANRQELLETAISWISGGKIEAYMAAHKNDKNANPLWLHFKKVITWVKATFPEHRKEMKSVDWGALYAAHNADNLDPVELETAIVKLMMDDDVSKKSGIYCYVLNGEEKHLSIRAFTPAMKREAYERQNHECPACSTPGKPKTFRFDEMEGDHIDPWHSGGKTTAANCKMLCKPCNRRKSGK